MSHWKQPKFTVIYRRHTVENPERSESRRCGGCGGVCRWIFWGHAGGAAPWLCCISGPCRPTAACSREETITEKKERLRRHLTIGLQVDSVQDDETSRAFSFMDETRKPIITFLWAEFYKIIKYYIADCFIKYWFWRNVGVLIYLVHIFHDPLCRIENLTFTYSKINALSAIFFHNFF
jgi:hypothetical protein